MELIKNIFFNTDRLTVFSSLKISYTGTLFQEKAKTVTLEYCFDKKWDTPLTKEMVISELGFQTEIDIPDARSLNFYFKDENGTFDSNNSENYNFEVERPQMALTVVENNKISNHLRKTYLWSKKVKIAVYKLLITIPKIITGNYKRKQTN